MLLGGEYFLFHPLFVDALIFFEFEIEQI